MEDNFQFEEFNMQFLSNVFYCNVFILLNSLTILMDHNFSINSIKLNSYNINIIKNLKNSNNCNMDN